MYQDSSYIFISVLSVVFIFGFETESDLHIKKLSQYKTQLLIPNSELINGIFSSKIIIFRTYECFLLCDFSVNTLANNCFKNKKCTVYTFKYQATLLKIIENDVYRSCTKSVL